MPELPEEPAVVLEVEVLWTATQQYCSTVPLYDTAELREFCASHDVIEPTSLTATQIEEFFSLDEDRWWDGNVDYDENGDWSGTIDRTLQDVQTR